MRNSVKTRKRVNRSDITRLNRQKRRIPKTSKPIRKRKRTQRMYKGGMFKRGCATRPKNEDLKECQALLRESQEQYHEASDKLETQATELEVKNGVLQEKNLELMVKNRELKIAQAHAMGMEHKVNQKDAIIARMRDVNRRGRNQLNDKTAELNSKTDELNDKTAELTKLAREMEKLSDMNSRNYDVAEQILQLYDTSYKEAIKAQKEANDVSDRHLAIMLTVSEKAKSTSEDARKRMEEAQEVAEEENKKANKIASDALNELELRLTNEKTLQDEIARLEGENRELLQSNDNLSEVLLDLASTYTLVASKFKEEHEQDIAEAREIGKEEGRAEAAEAAEAAGVAAGGGATPTTPRTPQRSQRSLRSLGSLEISPIDGNLLSPRVNETLEELHGAMKKAEAQRNFLLQRAASTRLSQPKPEATGKTTSLLQEEAAAATPDSDNPYTQTADGGVGYVAGKKGFLPPS